MNITGFSLAEAQMTLSPLLLFTAGVVVYSIFIFSFYRFLGKKDIFSLDLQQYDKGFSGFIKKTFRMLMYAVEYLVISPLFIFFWFGVISMILIVLSDVQDTAQILLVAMALVASIRVTAYYNEDLSKDLAKMFPFALLAVFLLDVTKFSYATFIYQLQSLPGMWKVMMYYLAFAIILEFVMRLLVGIKGMFSKET